MTFTEVKMHKFRTTRLDASLALLQGITYNLPAGLANYNWESPRRPPKHPLLFLGIWRLYVKCNLLYYVGIIVIASRGMHREWGWQRARLGAQTLPRDQRKQTSPMLQREYLPESLAMVTSPRTPPQYVNPFVPRSSASSSSPHGPTV